MALGATLSAIKFILWGERHLAATLSWLEATPTPKKLNLLISAWQTPGLSPDAEDY
jgi:hypothetical protein